RRSPPPLPERRPRAPPGRPLRLRPVSPLVLARPRPALGLAAAAGRGHGTGRALPAPRRGPRAPNLRRAVDPGSRRESRRRLPAGGARRGGVPRGAGRVGGAGRGFRVAGLVPPLQPGPAARARPPADHAGRGPPPPLTRARVPRGPARPTPASRAPAPGRAS